MAGRRRRGTTSSTESVALDQLRYRPESSVLKPVSSDVAENSWPTFELQDAVILGKDGHKLENALDVVLNGPFIVRGRMILEDEEQRSHLVSRVRAPVPIEIWPSQRYCIGETESGDAASRDNDHMTQDAPPAMSLLWVSGQGGWFEVNPAPDYIPLYRDICDAIKFFYTLYDIYQNATDDFIEANNGAIDPTERLAPLFIKYAVRVGSGITIQEVEQRCQDLAPFLISQFLDNINFWRKTYLYQWFKQTHEEIFKQILRFKRNPKAVPSDCHTERSLTTSMLPSRTRREPSPAAPNISQRNSSRARSTRSASTVMTGQAQVGVQSPTSAPRTTTGGVPRAESVHQSPTMAQTATEVITRSSPLADDEISPENGANGPLFESVFSAFSTALDGIANSKKGVTFNGLTNKLYFDHRFPNFKNGQPGCHRVPVEDVLHFNAKALLSKLDNKYRDTEVYTWLKEKSAMPFNPIALKTSDFPYRLIPRQKQAMPRGQKGSSQSIATNHAESPQGDQATHQYRSESPRAGKSLKAPGRRPRKSGLRLATTSKKRPISEVDSGSESDELEADTKRLHFFQDADGFMDEATGVGAVEEPENAVRIVIQADMAPSARPRGYNGAWTCDHDDCDYIVRGSDQAECQARIAAHFAHHEQQTDRVQLAISEGSRGHLQINNLLEKIRRLGEQKQQEAQPQTGPNERVVVPQTIKTNLIV